MAMKTIRFSKMKSFTWISARWLVCRPGSRSATFLKDRTFLKWPSGQSETSRAACVSQRMVEAPVHSDTSSRACFSVSRAAAVCVNDHSVAYKHTECPPHALYGQHLTAATSILPMYVNPSLLSEEELPECLTFFACASSCSSPEWLLFLPRGMYSRASGPLLGSRLTPDSTIWLTETKKGHSEKNAWKA